MKNFFPSFSRFFSFCFRKQFLLLFLASKCCWVTENTCFHFIALKEKEKIKVFWFTNNFDVYETFENFPFGCFINKTSFPYLNSDSMAIFRHSDWLLYASYKSSNVLMSYKYSTEKLYWQFCYTLQQQETWSIKKQT